MDFYNAWHFLSEHKIFNGCFESNLWTEVVKVNPETNEIDPDTTKNTKLQIWLEHGPWDGEWGSCTHDLNLDCGGDTFELAIIKLAELVSKYYTEDGQRKDPDTVKIYSMVYDSTAYGDNGLGSYLGEFKKIKQLREDAWVDDFIGLNTETQEICLIFSREITGHGGGIAYEVMPLPELTIKAKDLG
jgi:hypothetical protein